MQIYAEKKSSASPLVYNVEAVSHNSSHPCMLVFSTSFALHATGDPWMTAGVSWLAPSSHQWVGGILATQAKTLSIKIQGNERNNCSGSMGLDLTHGWLGESGWRGIYPTSRIPWHLFIYRFPLLCAQNVHVLPCSCGRGFRVWNFARLSCQAWAKLLSAGLSSA